MTITPTATKRARWLALLLLIISLGLMALGPYDTPNAATGTLPDGYESTLVAEQREQAQAAQSDNETGPTGKENPAIVLYTGITPEDMPTLQERAQTLGGPLIPNENADAALVLVQVESASLTDNVDAVTQLRDQASQDLPEGIDVAVTGPAAIEADLSGVFSGANFTLLAVTAIIVALLLVITYRSPVLWIIPLLVIGIADRLVATLYPRVLDAFGMIWNESTGGILSVLVFGAGTNYALLLISRYRDELTTTNDRFAAMAKAWKPTVMTILASATTVILGVLCLLASLTPTTRSLGAAAAFGIVIAFIFGAFVLPGVLVSFGRWIFWPKIPQQGDTTEHKVFDRIGATVAAKPVTVLVSSLIALGIMCSGALGITTGLTQSDQFIDTPESIAGAERLSEAFPDMSATPAIIATEQSDEEAVRTRLDAAELTYRPTDDGMLQVSGATTEELREILSETGALVGGPDAELYDTEQAAAHDRMIIFPLVLILMFIALIVLLRSFVAPLIMAASVLLTNVAALGIGWWVSHYIFGFERFDSTTPLYAFVFLVALGIDYTIFLVTRAREDSEKIGARRGILAALSSTGGVITSAGILLAAVFAALGVLPLVVLAQIGIIICLGVLLDTLIVRSLVVPALVQLIGEKFWWPARPSASHEQTPA